MKEDAILPSLLKDLKLPAMGQHWERLGKISIERGWSPTRYLVELCEQEVTEREKRRLSRYMLQSQLPRGKSLETYDFKYVPSLNKAQIMALGSGDMWIKSGMNLLIFGPSGLGKTHLAAGIGEMLVIEGYRVFFTRTTELLQKLQSAKRDLSLPSALDKLDKYDCLILDDFGYVQRNKTETNILFELICDRYERKSLLITCNQVFKEWDQIFTDKRMAIAAIDRLVHHATLLELNGESYRKREALSNMRRKRNGKKNSLRKPVSKETEASSDISEKLQS